MADCLDGLVGVYCPDGVPNTDSTEFYLSDLPGIHLAGASQIADHESVKGSDLMTKAIAFSQKILVRDFVQRLRSDFLVMEVVSQDRIDRHGTNFLPTADQYTGKVFSLYDPNDRYTFGYLEYIELKVNSTAANEPIWYQIDNQTPASITHNFVPGYNRIQLDLSFNETLRVWVDNNNVSISDGEEGITGAINRKCVTDCSYDYCNNCLYANSITAPIVADPTTDPITWTTALTYNGFVSFVSCKSSPSEIVCTFRSELAAPLLYRAGGYLMDQLISSDRATPYVRNTKEEAKLLRAQWLGGPDPITGWEIKGEYPRFLQQAVSNAQAVLNQSSSSAFKQTEMLVANAVFPHKRIRGRGSRRMFRKNY